MIKLIHAADFHLDAAFSSLSAEQSQERRAELRQLPHRLAALAEDQNADLVLLSGDLFDGDETYFETTQALAQALGQIKARVFIAPGNHDYYHARSPYATISWPDNVHIFTSNQITSVELPELGCIVHGGAFTGPYWDDSPLSDFTAPQDNNLHLMVLHGDVDGHGRYGSIAPLEIAQSNLHYLALGHVHTCSGVNQLGRTFWAYPGCPEGRGFDETGDKGVLCGTLDSQEAHMVFIPLCKRRYELVTVDLTGKTSAEALASALSALRPEDICRIHLTGERDNTPLDLPALEAIISPRFYHASLRDLTRVRRDLWARMEEDTLTGLFLQELREAYDTAWDEESRAMVEQAVRFGLAALENGEDCCP